MCFSRPNCCFTPLDSRHNPDPSTSTLGMVNTSQIVEWQNHLLCYVMHSLFTQALVGILHDLKQIDPTFWMVETPKKLTLSSIQVGLYLGFRCTEQFPLSPFSDW